MYNIKLLNNISASGLEQLPQDRFYADKTVETPDAILVRSFKMHDYNFNPELLCIARAGAGTNNIPSDICAEKGIVVFNTPGANAEAVKELCVCALFMASRDILGGIEWVKSIVDEGDAVPAMIEKGKASFTGPELMGKTLGVIGLGAIGARIANTALGLGMSVYGYDPYLSVDAAWQLSRSVKHAVDLDTIFSNCDYITLHVPCIDATRGMINEEAIAKMKNGVRIINLARGELVNDDDMIAALDSGKVARYVTDFPNARIAAAANVVPMPHLGASTPESEDKCALMAVQELVEYIENGNIINSVNLPSAQLDRQGEARICVIHKNVPRMINGFLDVIGGLNINVEHMINKARGEYAYTIIDVGSKIDEESAKRIQEIEGVIRVRIL